MNAKRIFIVAGEASGDMLGGALMKALRESSPLPLQFEGIGGERMQAAGLISLFPMQELSLMGFVEILPHAWRLACLLKRACDAAVGFQPDLVITIDSPGFTFRLVKWLRQCYGDTITCIHYVAPTVWAYKPERAATTALLFDHLLTLLPFEAPYFQAYGLPVTYVGHPVADGFNPDPAPPRAYRLGDSLHIALFPGSRKGEVNRLLPIFHHVMILLRKRYRALRISLVTTESLRSHVERMAAQWRHRPDIVEGEAERDKALNTAHLALTKTGTVTLEIARHNIPMVATYRVHPLTAWAVRHMLKIPFVNLINIMAGRQVIPELIQEECSAQPLYQALCRLIDDPGAMTEQAASSQEALLCMQNRTSSPASEVAAEVILSYINDTQHLRDIP